MVFLKDLERPHPSAGRTWRRGWDSNPRIPFGYYWNFSPAPSTTRPPLRRLRSLTAGALRGKRIARLLRLRLRPGGGEAPCLVEARVARLARFELGLRLGDLEGILGVGRRQTFGGAQWRTVDGLQVLVVLRARVAPTLAVTTGERDERDERAADKTPTH